MEQLILRGGEASSLGERSNLQDAVIGEMRSRGLGAGSRADAAEKAAQINAKGMYRRYIDSVRSLGIGGQFVDKTPMNVLYAGLIAAGCAGARTVCMLREPKDLVAGIFRTDFGGLYPFALDPVDLAKYVKAFGRLVTHWNSTIPPTLFRAVRYEDLAANPTREGAATFAFMGLRWRDQFVESKAGPAVAVSASAAQVHAPIDTSRVAVWRVYEAHMAEAFELLAD